MSRLWDTPEFWARTEADELLREHPHSEVRALADSLSVARGGDADDPDFMRDVVAELYKRADAGIRFWAEHIDLAAIEEEVRAMLLADEGEDGAKASTFWWQRM